MKNVELTGVADFIKSLYTPPVEESVEESVELDEAIDFRKAHQEIMAYAKKSGGIDKTDFEKVAYYVKAIGDNQNTPNVANKAFMAMKKHIDGLDTDVRDGIHVLLKKHGMVKNGRMVQESVELDEAIGKLGPNASREDKIKHTMKIMKMYPANKGKSEKELRKGATDYIDQFTNKNKRDDAYIAKMKAKKESVDEVKTGLPTGQSTVDYENSIQKLMMTLKKDPKNKGKSGNELRKLATLKLTGHKLKEDEELDEAALEEKTKWKMGDGRPRNGPRIENDRFWNLPYDSLKYIAKDAGEAMKANPTARKATTGPGNWADQVADAATVMQWRKKNGIRESVELDEAKLPISDEMFKSLKKGDKIKIGFDSSIKKGNENTYVVKSKSKSAKYNLEKITLKNVANPVAQASYLYNRQGKVTMAHGDMAVTMNTAVKESVDEAKKPVSQMTPAEKAADAKRRKEYNAFQKSKRNETTQGIDARTKIFKEKVKKLAYMKDSSIKTRKLMGAYDMKTLEGNKKVAFAISKAKNEEDLLARLESISKMGEGQYAEAISRNVFEKAVVQFRKK